MLVFSRSIGERTGNLEVNQAQFRELEMARNMSAQSVADFIARARFGENGHLDAVNAVDDIRRMYRAYDQTVLAQFEPNHRIHPVQRPDAIVTLCPPGRVSV